MLLFLPAVAWAADPVVERAVTVSATVADQSFGTAVVGAGDVDGDGCDDLLVTAPTRRAGGVGVIFLDRPGGPSEEDALVLPDPEGAGVFGFAAAGGGDMNGDGYADVVLAAGGGRGAAYLYDGGPRGPHASPDGRLEPLPQRGPISSLAFAGDVDGDGFDDVVMGTPESSAVAAGLGAAWLYPGGAAAPGAGEAVSAPNDCVGLGAVVGDLVGAAGDVDGDGFADVIVRCEFAPASVPNYPGNAPRGLALLFPGGSAGMEPDPVAVLAPNRDVGNFDDFAYTIAAADFDQDGHPDLAIGAPNAHGGGTAGVGRGAVFLLPGSAVGPVAKAAVSFDVGRESADFGLAMAAGDLDGDGFPDLVVAAPAYQSPEFAAALFLYRGTVDGLETAPITVLSRGDALLNSRATLAVVGDIEGDGRTWFGYTTSSGGSPEGVTLFSWCPGGDADGDGACEDADCNDADPSVYPGAEDVCDGVDQDCDGRLGPPRCGADDSAASPGCGCASGVARSWGHGVYVALVVVAGRRRSGRVPARRTAAPS